jgi:hypothetical protein
MAAQVIQLFQTMKATTTSVEPRFSPVYDSWWYVSSVLLMMAAHIDITLAIRDDELGLACHGRIFRKSSCDDLGRDIQIGLGRFCLEDMGGSCWWWYGKTGLLQAIRVWHVSIIPLGKRTGLMLVVSQAASLETHMNYVYRFAVRQAANHLIGSLQTLGIVRKDITASYEGRSPDIILEELNKHDKLLLERFSKAYNEERGLGRLPRSFDYLCPGWWSVPVDFVTAHVTYVSPLVGKRLEWSYDGGNKWSTIYRERRMLVQQKLDERRRGLSALELSAAKSDWSRRGLPGGDASSCTVM